jgi:transcriptional repressor NrdR
VRCPLCAGLDTKVLDSRDAQDGAAIRRRRVCQQCGHRFTTRERVEELVTTVVKRSGDREPFDRAKARRGLELACRKRPIQGEQLDALVGKVEHWAATRGDREVPSAAIGERIAHWLHELDEVAYVRFVSVYRSFETIAEFEHLLNELEKAERVDPAGQRPLFDTGALTGAPGDPGAGPPARSASDAGSEPDGDA